MELKKELKELLVEKGAVLVGIADMKGIANAKYSTGVAVGIPLPKSLIRELENAPNEEYYRLYSDYNDKLNKIVLCGEEFLKEKGFEAYAQTTDRVVIDDDRISPLPHKTVATRAGLGWIGKNCLLVTPEYGPALRISSLLTNAPLECAEAIEDSKCGECNSCVECCPAKALKGAVWKAGMKREEFVDANLCFDTQVQIMEAKTGIKADLCGKCFARCQYTQKYLNTK